MALVKISNMRIFLGFIAAWLLSAVLTALFFDYSTQDSPDIASNLITLSFTVVYILPAILLGVIPLIINLEKRQKRSFLSYFSYGLAIAVCTGLLYFVAAGMLTVIAFMHVISTIILYWLFVVRKYAQNKAVEE